MKEARRPHMSRACVLSIGPSPPPYNGMSVATDLVLKAMGNEVEHVHLDTSDRRGLANVGKFDFANLWLAAVHATKYLWLLITRRPKVVYVPISQAWLPFLRDCLFLVPAKLMRRTVVIHLHGGYFGTFFRQTTALMRSIIRFSLADAARAVVLGKKVECAFQGILPLDRIRIIPNGIPDLFNTSRSNEGNQSCDVLFLSTLMADKGVLDLLRALLCVHERIGSVRSIFAGEWYSELDRKVAADVITAFPNDSRPEFVGAVDPLRKRDLLKSSAVFVFPTFYPFEGHPYVILEAMAAGLPIVSTNWACIPEMVEDGVNGFLIEPRNVEMLAASICSLLTNHELRLKMGAASRERFLREFTFETFADKMRGVFAEAMSPAPALQAAESV
jgi:glycosyltransferase involved in cell wall biosynthesis